MSIITTRSVGEYTIKAQLSSQRMGKGVKREGRRHQVEGERERRVMERRREKRQRKGHGGRRKRTKPRNNKDEGTKVEGER